MTDPTTILDAFRELIANPETRQRHAAECADEHWTYDDLDVISTGLAMDLENRYGAHPTVAIIAENLPYTFALHLAVWKLGGIVASIEYHTPVTLLNHRLAKISPSCVIVPSTEKGMQQVVLGTFTTQS
jgi:acyl-coenzyme A synthetase/AMP-(fatty) acid ligase